MFILRLIVVVLVAFVVNRLVRAALRAPQGRGRSEPDGGVSRRRYRDLTEQDVSDADYEEIP